MPQTNCQTQTNSVSDLFSSFTSEPEDRIAHCPDTAWNIDPLWSTVIITNIAKDYFSNEANWENNPLNALFKVTPLQVSTLADWNAKKVDYLPRLHVEFGGAQLKPELGFYNRVGYNTHSGTESFQSEWSIGHTFYAIAGSLNETLLLQGLVRELLHYYQLQIAKALTARLFKIVEIGKPQALADESGTANGFCGTINTVLTVEEAWSVRTDAPLIKRIKIGNE